MDAVANRVRRVATGWETQLTLAVDGILSRLTLLELCEAFYAVRPAGADSGPGTRLRLRTEVLAGTWEALVSGQADLALGVPLEMSAPGIEVKPLGDMEFVFAMAPHHPLAALPEPLPDEEILRHRAVAVADSAQRLSPLTVNLLPGQDTLTVSSMQAKIEAQLRCLGCGFVPEPLVRDHLRAGRLVAKQVQRQRRQVRLGYAWRTGGAGGRRAASQGLALQWWLQQLESPTTRAALLVRHCGLPSDVD